MLKLQPMRSKHGSSLSLDQQLYWLLESQIFFAFTDLRFHLYFLGPYNDDDRILGYHILDHRCLRDRVKRIRQSQIIERICSVISFLPQSTDMLPGIFVPQIPLQVSNKQ